VSRVLRPARHITGHFRDESLQAITCTGTDNSKQTGGNTSKSQKYKINKLALVSKTHKNTLLEGKRDTIAGIVLTLITVLNTQQKNNNE